MLLAGLFLDKASSRYRRVKVGYRCDIESTTTLICTHYALQFEYLILCISPRNYILIVVVQFPIQFQRKHLARALLLLFLAFVLFNITALRHQNVISKTPRLVPATRAYDGYDSRLGNRCAVRTVMESDGYVRNCVTGRVLGRLPAGGAFRTESLADVFDNVTENADVRRRVFKKVFEKRIWRHSDSAYKGPAVSGTICQVIGRGYYYFVCFILQIVRTASRITITRAHLIT